MSVRIDGEKSGRGSRADGVPRESLPRLHGRSRCPAWSPRPACSSGFWTSRRGVPALPAQPDARAGRGAARALGPFAAALAISAGVLLLLLAHGLKRRKRRAWRAAVVLLPAGAVAQFTYRHSLIGVVVSLALLVGCCCATASEFAALPDPRSRWKALANFVLMGAGSIGLGLLIVSAHPGRMVGDPSLADQLEHVIYGLFGFEGPVDYAGTTSWTVGYSLGALGLLTAITTIYLAFRPEHPAARLTADDEARLRELLARHGGRDSLGHFALRRDKAVVFSPSGKAAVTYRVVSGVMLASGDPIGDVEAWPGAIERFMEEAKAHSWTPAVDGLPRDRRRGVDPRDRPGRPGTGRRGDGGRRGLLPRRTRDAQRPPDGEAHRAERLRDPGPARPRPERGGAGADPARRRGLARHRHRARLLHGARPGRRPGRRRLPHRHRPQGARRATRPVRRPEGRTALRPVGHGRHVAGADAPRPRAPTPA